MRIVAALVAGVASVAQAAPAPAPAAAQDAFETIPDVVADKPVPETVVPVRFVVPDFAPGRQIFPELDTRLLRAALSIEMIGDWTGFSQNSASIAQVGVQESRFEVRSARLRFIGGIGGGYRFSYTVAAQYRGFDVDPDRTWEVTDLALNYLVNKGGTRISIGQIRETFSYEIIGNTASMPQSERILSPFAASRNIGISATHVFGADRDWTVSAGYFRDSFGFSGSGLGATARLTHLLYEDAAMGRYLHLGLGYRHRAADDGVIRYRSRPASNVADNFVDTGNFPSNGADHIGIEALWSDGGVSVLGEYVGAFVDAPDVGSPYFQGFYVTGSWVLTGENRPYDRARGLARRIVPTGRWGAPELVARYAAVDLDGGSVRGGSYDRIDLGINWWATTRWKFGADVGRTWLRSGGTRGTTDSLLMRAQWVY